MSRPKRNSALIAAMALAGAMAAAVFGLFSSAGRLGAEPEAAAATGYAHVTVSIQPRSQSFASGGNASFTIFLTNTGSVALDSVSVSGSPVSGCNRNSLSTLQPGESASYSCGRNNVTQSFLNTITARVQAPNGVTIERSADGFVRVALPDIDILKQPEVKVVRNGGKARFSVKLFNTTNIDYEDVEVRDVMMPDCDRDYSVLEKGDSESYFCFLDNATAPATTFVVARAKLSGGGDVGPAAAAAWVEIIDLDAALTAVPASLPEPGGPVSFTITLTNPGSIPLRLATLETDQFGDLLDSNNPAVPAATNTCLPGQALPSLAVLGGRYICSFTAEISVQPSAYGITLTAVADSTSVPVDQNEPRDATTTAETIVMITDLPSTLSLNVAADPSFVNVPGGVISYSVQLVNGSAMDSLTVNNLSDSSVGDLNGVGSCQTPVTSLVAGTSYTCAFTDTVSGKAGDVVTRTVSAAGLDDDLPPNPISASKVISIPISDWSNRVFLPDVTDDTVEPNRSCLDAYPLQLDREYFFLPPGTFQPGNPSESDQDYFSFALDQAAATTVRLTNFTPIKGQLIIYELTSEEGPCNKSLKQIAQDASSALNKTLELGTLASGKYFVRILNDGPGKVQKFYGLTIDTK